MDNYSIIIRPLITEQSMHFANTKSAYSLEVNKEANKIQIKNAVEKLYNVKVKEVRTANHKGKPRRRGRSFGTTPSWKKAIIKIDTNPEAEKYLTKSGKQAQENKKYSTNIEEFGFIQ